MGLETKRRKKKTFFKRLTLGCYKKMKIRCTFFLLFFRSCKLSEVSKNLNLYSVHPILSSQLRFYWKILYKTKTRINWYLKFTGRKFKSHFRSSENGCFPKRRFWIAKNTFFMLHTQSFTYKLINTGIII